MNNDDLTVAEMAHDMQECMTAFHQVTSYRPTVLDARTALLRVKLHQGEDTELTDALADGDLVEQFDACIDLLYVVYGTMVANGTINYLARGWRDVHENNMSKLVNGEPLLDASGKFVKPPGYKPVDLSWILDKVEKPGDGFTPECFGKYSSVKKCCTTDCDKRHACFELGRPK